MKKSKLLVLGLIALMLAGGLVLAGCNLNCSNKGECTYNPGKSSSTCSNDSCSANKALNSGNGSGAGCDC